MDEIILQHPVHTLDNKELLPVGAVFTPDSIDNVLSLNQGKPSQTLPFLSHETIEDDMRKQLATPPYRVIFTEEDVDDLMVGLKDIALITPVIEAIDYFKGNDYYNYRHFLTVFALTTLLAGDLVADEKVRAEVFASGPSHDFGKICVPLPVLKKLKPLTKQEHTIIKQHTVAGYTLLSYYLGDANQLTAHVALNHHERKDGSGYPRKIKSDNFITEIIAVCDIYDALISRRPYRPVSFDNRTALEEIIEMAVQGKIGWHVAKALISRNRSQRPEGSNFEIPFTRRGKPPVNNVYGVVADDNE